MRLPTIAICVIAGICPLLWLPELPTVAATGGVTLLGAALCFFARPLRAIGLMLLFFCWGIFAAHDVASPANALSGKVLQAEVEILAVDGEEKYYAKLLSINGLRQFPAPGIVLYGQRLSGSACAGQLWRMTLRTRAVHGLLNAGMFDSQRYALSLNRPLTGRFTHAEVVQPGCSLRARFVTSLLESVERYPWHQVMLGLAVGERASVPADVKLLLQQTGTSHLMAISGLHISMVAMLGWLAVRGMQSMMPGEWIGWRAPVCATFCVGAFYGWLSGMEPPALRTVVATGIWLLLRMRGYRWTSWEVWLCCVAAILLFDPLAILAQSLWLSAFAVATLIFWYQWVPFRRIGRSALLNAIWGLVHLQAGLMFLLLPLQIFIFNGISWTSLPANFVAVPLVTLGAIPLLLAGMALHLTGPEGLEHVVWLLADRLLASLFWFLRALPEGWREVDSRWQSLSLLPWLGVVLWRLDGWRKWPGITLTCCALLAFPLWRPSSQAWSVTMLDVGQGLAMVIARNGKAILYDTGLAWKEGDSAKQLIIPWLRWHHLTPEGIILSHEHLDHRGGLNTLLKTWPGVWVRSSLPWPNHRPCQRGEGWRWQGLTFRALWPLPGNTAEGNNRSCVVRVDDGQNSFLMTGDIEIPAEMSMLSHYWPHLASTLVQVPHHGSSTSSSQALLQAVGGQAALSSAARYNAWHFPSAKVKARYIHREYQWFDTARQGQITVNFSTEGWQIRSLRDQISPRWYHQWFGDARDNG